MSAEETNILLSEQQARVCTLTLNRPEKLNAFNLALFETLHRALADAAADDSVHAVLLTGAGRAFSAGADLTDMAKANASQDGASAWDENTFDLVQRTAETFPKPLVAAVNGLAVGFGFTILGYCDFCFVAESAKLRTPFAQLGVSPEGSSSYLFPLRMGWTRAAYTLMLGDWLTPQELVTCGFAQEVVPDAQLLETATAFANRLAAQPLQSLVATKSLMLHAHGRLIAEIRDLERLSMQRLVGSPANREAIAAFAASRSRPKQ